MAGVGNISIGEKKTMACRLAGWLTSSYQPRPGRIADEQTGNEWQDDSLQGD